MSLYLDELFLPTGTLEAKEAIRMINKFSNEMKSGVISEDYPMIVKAGPWFSNEDLRIILIVEIDDHSRTFVTFWNGVLKGTLVRRRLTPIVDGRLLEAFLEGPDPTANLK